MALHQTSGRWRLGLLLASVTALFWSTLPISLKLVLEQVDAWTITWIRFVSAAVALALWLALRHGLAAYRGHGRRIWWMMLVAAVMLTGNFVGYLFGIEYTTPANAQLLIQAAPLLLALGGVLVFRERFSAVQWSGLTLVAIGLLGFSLDQSRQTQGIAQNYALGALIVFGAALVWAIYALLQKQLLNHLGSQHLLLFIYAVASLLLLPMARPTTLLTLDALHGWALFYCCLNTIGAYGAFAEALAHWQASRVGVVLALTPMLAVAAIAAFSWLRPGLVRAEQIALLGWCGVALVVFGSVLVSVARADPPA